MGYARSWASGPFERPWALARSRPRRAGERRGYQDLAPSSPRSHVVISPVAPDANVALEAQYGGSIRRKPCARATAKKSRLRAGIAGQNRPSGPGVVAMEALESPGNCA